MFKVRSATHLREQFQEECWYAVYTRTRHEKCVAEHCTQRGITAFLPLYHVQRRWKQRRAEVFLPLFASYIFVHIALRDRARILVAIEDDRTGLVPVAPKRAEEAELQKNLGEFPTALTDQGDRQPTPAVKSERAIAQDVGSRLRSAFKRKRSGTSK